MPWPRCHAPGDIPQGKLDQAIGTYHRAIAVQPQFPEAYNNLGNALREAGRSEEAIAAYTTCIQLQVCKLGWGKVLCLAWCGLRGFCAEQKAAETHCMHLHLYGSLMWCAPRPLPLHPAAGSRAGAAAGGAGQPFWASCQREAVAAGMWTGMRFIWLPGARCAEQACLLSKPPGCLLTLRTVSARACACSCLSLARRAWLRSTRSACRWPTTTWQAF